MALLFSGAEPLCNFARRHHEKQFCEIILNLDQWFRKRSHLKYFLSRALVALFASERSHLCNSGRGYHQESSKPM